MSCNAVLLPYVRFDCPAESDADVLDHSICTLIEWLEGWTCDGIRGAHGAVRC
jgi:hypothetical protein